MRPSLHCCVLFLVAAGCAAEPSDVEDNVEVMNGSKADGTELLIEHAAPNFYATPSQLTLTCDSPTGCDVVVVAHLGFTTKSGDQPQGLLGDWGTLSAWGAGDTPIYVRDKLSNYWSAGAVCPRGYHVPAGKTHFATKIFEPEAEKLVGLGVVRADASFEATWRPAGGLTNLPAVKDSTGKACPAVQFRPVAK